MTVFKHALIQGLKSPAALILGAFMPVVFILLMGTDANGETRVYYVVAMSLMWGAFLMAKNIKNDQMSGVVVRILAGPVTLRSYLTQNFFAAMAPATALSVLVCLIGMAVHGWELIFAAWLALCYAMLTATTIGLSFVWSCLFKTREASQAAFGMVVTFMAFLGGLLLPLDILPRVVYNLGMVFPAHWAARAIETLLLYGATTQYWLSLLAMLMFTTAFLLYGGRRSMV